MGRIRRREWEGVAVGMGKERERKETRKGDGIYVLLYYFLFVCHVCVWGGGGLSPCSFASKASYVTLALLHNHDEIYCIIIAFDLR